MQDPAIPFASNPPSHADLLHAIQHLQRRVAIASVHIKSNGRKLDTLLRHLGADFTSEDTAVLEETEEVQDAKDRLPHPEQPTNQ